MAVRRYKDVGSVIAVEIGFNVTGNIVGAVFAIDFHIDSRILAGGTVLSEMTSGGIAEWDGPEVGRSHVARVGGAENVFKIHESARREVRAADGEGKRSLF